MPQIRKSALLPYSAERMFDLVARVTDYPQFMPWCGGAREAAAPDGRVRATVDINYHGVKSSFTTLNRNEPHSAIAMQFVDGPFSALDGLWRFTSLTGDACKVEFNLDYEFAGGIFGKLVAPVFDVIAKSFIDAFSKRAEALYG
ncbi:MAG: putative oligoketide cyclase/lipid transport protein [Betaproteobacteria bacterium]|nr:putative oligoketide cyclase/lipid transport protein [Betaproteobacteria bacterium]